jgi:glycosyltransferase involved in cell wall biosynthesis
MNSAPLVSVGLFVYNGERFIEEALQSILNQTFTDFELIISDNASTRP